MDPRRFYLGASAFYGFAWTTTTTVNLVFMVVVAGLDPLQMVLVGTALEISAFLFEIPTGVVADTISRKWSVVIGHALIGLGFLLIPLVPVFWAIVVSQVIWGLGATFVSGAYVAWLSGEVGVETANRTLVRAAKLAQAGGFVGIVFAVALAHAGLHWPILVGACAILALSLAMAVGMREAHFAPARDESRETFAAMAATVREGTAEIRRQPLLGIIFGITIVFGAFSEGLDRLFTPFLIEGFDFPSLFRLDSVVWWGVIAAGSTLSALLATHVAERRVETGDPLQLTTVLGGLTAGIGALVIGLANLDGFFAVVALYWIVQGLRGALEPLSTAWLNHRLPESRRATLLSMAGQADAVGQMAGGPLVGAIAKRASIGAALTVSGLLLLPSLWLYRLAARRGREEAEQGAS